jgi:hypothetical protein
MFGTFPAATLPAELRAQAAADGSRSDGGGGGGKGPARGSSSASHHQHHQHHHQVGTDDDDASNLDVDVAGGDASARTAGGAAEDASDGVSLHMHILPTFSASLWLRLAAGALLLAVPHMVAHSRVSRILLGIAASAVAIAAMVGTYAARGRVGRATALVFVAGGWAIGGWGLAAGGAAGVVAGVGSVR